VRVFICWHIHLNSKLFYSFFFWGGGGGCYWKKLVLAPWMFLQIAVTQCWYSYTNKWKLEFIFKYVIEHDSYLYYLYMDTVLISLVKSFGENEIFVTNVIIAAVKSVRAHCIYIKNLFYINERLINFLVAGQMYHFRVLLFAHALLLLQILTYGIS